MKQLILIIFLGFSTSLFSQNWQPIPTQSARLQFKMIDTIFNFNQFHDFPIQTVVVKSKYADSAGTSLKLKKGFYIQSVLANRNQLIKGQIIGDSAFVNHDSSRFFTSDTFGFSLSFPHSFQLNDTFILGKSHNRVIKANVVLLYTDTINHSIDSVALIRQNVYDLNGSLDSAHQFNNQSLRIAKQNGLIECINFSNLWNSKRYVRIFINDTISEGLNNRLQVGDEIHWTLDSSIYPNYVLRNCISSIDSINWNGSIKTTHYTTYATIPYVPTPFQKLSNDSLVVDTAMIFKVLESNVVEDSCLKFPFCGWSTTFDQFYYGKGKINLFLGNHYQQVMTLSNPISFDSINGPTGSLSGSESNRLIGLWTENHQWGFAGVGSDHVTTKIVYYKLGNELWGSPFNLTTNLFEISDKAKYESIELFPNPVKAQLNLQLNEQQKIRSVRVFDLLGKNYPMAWQNKKYQLKLDVADLPKGIYLLQVETENGLLTEKFVKE